MTAMAERLMWGLRYVVLTFNSLLYYEEHHQDKLKITLNLYEALDSFHIIINRILDGNDGYDVDWSYIS